MTVFEELGVAYEERDGLFYPVVSMERERINVGKYGLLWMEYIKENASDRYKSLLRFGKLEEKALEVNREQARMVAEETVLSAIVYHHY